MFKDSYVIDFEDKVPDVSERLRRTSGVICGHGGSWMALCVARNWARRDVVCSRQREGFPRRPYCGGQ